MVERSLRVAHWLIGFLNVIPPAVLPGQGGACIHRLSDAGSTRGTPAVSKKVTTEPRELSKVALETLATDPNSELLMSLAWSNLNRTTPDLTAAEQYAEAALKLVPYWHYLRDILMPQIRAAQAKAAKR